MRMFVLIYFAIYGGANLYILFNLLRAWRGAGAPWRRGVAAGCVHIRGRHRVGERLRLYVSPGTGSWGAPKRLGTTREVTLFILAAP